MATISNTPRPGYVWDSTDNVWYPIGTGPHTHADYITSGSAINPNIVDAKGDIIAATAADTVARLAVGANDTVLTADSSTATGLKWAAVAAGAGNMAQIATGTLSGASTQITGLSTYTDILIFVYGTTNNTANGNVYMRLNSTATNHNTYGAKTNGTAFSTTQASNDSDFYLSGAGSTDRTSVNNVHVVKLTNCKNAGFTDVDIYSTYLRGGGGQAFDAFKGIYTKSEAISTIDLRQSGGTWAGGTYYVWGA